MLFICGHQSPVCPAELADSEYWLFAGDFCDFCLNVLMDSVNKCVFTGMVGLSFFTRKKQEMFARPANLDTMDPVWQRWFSCVESCTWRGCLGSLKYHNCPEQVVPGSVALWMDQQLSQWCLIKIPLCWPLLHEQVLSRLVFSRLSKSGSPGLDRYKWQSPIRQQMAGLSNADAGKSGLGSKPGVRSLKLYRLMLQKEKIHCLLSLFG